MRDERADLWKRLGAPLLLLLCAAACYRIEPSNLSNAAGNANSNARRAPTPSPAPTSTPSPTPQPGLSQGEAVPPSTVETAPAGGQLLIPVAGVRAEELRDTYIQSRSEERAHNAIDIIAPRGTPVLAAADGRVVKLFQSVPGGITVYQLSTDNRTILYYAHLERYADGLTEGHFARRGEVLGYVGDTGNAGAGNYHLHFSVSVTDDPKRWWDGANVNPYPLLTGKQ